MTIPVSVCVCVATELTLASNAVFLQLTPHTEKVSLQESEVQSIRWVGVRWIAEQLSQMACGRKDLHCGSVTVRLNRLILPISRVLSDEMNDRLGLSAHFPSLYLHQYDRQHHCRKDYVLWGMTLKFTVKMLEASHAIAHLRLSKPIQQLTRKLNGYNPRYTHIDLLFRLRLADWYNDDDPLLRRIVAILGILIILGTTIVLWSMAGAQIRLQSKI